MRFFPTAFSAAVISLLAVMPLYASDYPMAGDLNSTYQKVFDDIDKGCCYQEMDRDLKPLVSSENISGNIYRAICFFKDDDPDQGFTILDTMLNAQEYDEIIYVCGTLETAGLDDPRVQKYKGLAASEMGDQPTAEKALAAYLDKVNDDSVRQTYIDVLVAMQEYNKAGDELSKLTIKDGAFAVKIGRIASKMGRDIAALKALRTVQPTDRTNYPVATLLINDICAKAKRFVCSNEELARLKGPDFAEVVAGRQTKLDKGKDPFSGFIAFSEDYDNNVTAVDPDVQSGVSKKHSFRSSVAADLRYNIYPAFADKVTVGMLNYKSWNYSVPSYNIQVHNAYFEVHQSTDNFDFVLPKVSAGMTYFGGKKYSENFAIESSAAYKMDGMTVTIPVKIEKRNYFNVINDNTEDRDGYLYSIGTKVFKVLNTKFALKGGVTVEVEDTAGKEKDASNYKFDLGGIYSYSRNISFSLSTGYDRDNFVNSSDHRDDSCYDVELTGTYRLTENMFLSAGVTWNRTDSNDNMYDYDKTVYNTTVGYSF